MELLQVIGAVVIGFTVVLVLVPSILRVARLKHLFEPFEERKIHTKLIPPLGGVAIFIGFVLSATIATYGLEFETLRYLILSVLLMFFVGLKDDLVNMNAKKKLLVQVWAAAIIVVMADVRFTNLHGILGIYEIGFIPSFILSLFAIVVITNALNLIDGIDGLASGLAIFASGVLGTWFYFTGNYQLAVISFALVGCLFAFFLYNVFGHSNKLFMGDSGSLIIGIVISALIIQFNELNLVEASGLRINAAPAVSFAILIVPLMDTLRVMFIRIAKRKSPFTPDNNHIHHRLLQLYSKHIIVTSILVLTSVFLVGISLLLNGSTINLNLQFFIIVVIALALFSVPTLLINKKGLSKAKTHRPIKKVARMRPEYVPVKPKFRNDVNGKNKPAQRRQYGVGSKEREFSMPHSHTSNGDTKLIVLGKHKNNL